MLYRTVQTQHTEYDATVLALSRARVSVYVPYTLARTWKIYWKLCTMSRQPICIKKLVSNKILCGCIERSLSPSLSKCRSREKEASDVRKFYIRTNWVTLSNAVEIKCGRHLSVNLFKIRFNYLFKSPQFCAALPLKSREIQPNLWNYKEYGAWIWSFWPRWILNMGRL